MSSRSGTKKKSRSGTKKKSRSGTKKKAACSYCERLGDPSEMEEVALDTVCEEWGDPVRICDDCVVMGEHRCGHFGCDELVGPGEVCCGEDCEDGIPGSVRD